MLGSHRRAFRPCHFICHIPELSAQPGKSSYLIFLLYVLERRSNSNAQGFGCCPELNRSLVALFSFVDLGELFK